MLRLRAALFVLVQLACQQRAGAQVVDVALSELHDNIVSGAGTILFASQLESRVDGNNSIKEILVGDELEPGLCEHRFKLLLRREAPDALH